MPADSTTAIRFLPNAGYTGTLDDAITFLAWDQAVGTPGTLFDTTSGSAAAAFSATSAVVPLTVYDSEQAPTVSITGPGTIAADDWATFTVTLSQPSDQTVSVDWMPQDGTAVYPDDWTQGTVSGGYELYTTQDGYEVNAVQSGTLTDGYDYPAYSVDTGYYQTTYSNNDYSVDTGYYAGYQYNSYTVDEGTWQDGYDYNSYTTDGQVLTDGYYYPSYSIANTTTVTGYTVTDLWEDEGTWDPTTGLWDSDIEDVPVTPFFTTAWPDPTWAQYYSDSQQQPDGTYDTGDGYWAPDATPDTSWPGQHTFAGQLPTEYALAV